MAKFNSGGLSYIAGKQGAYSFGGAKPITVAPPPKPRGNVLSAQTGPIGPQRPIGPMGPPQGYSAQGGGQAQSGAGQQQSQMTQQSVYEPTPNMPAIDFDAIIAPALQGLDATIAPLEQQSQANIQGIEGRRTTDIQRTNANIAGQQQTLGQAGTRQQQEAESAANESRRQFSEIQQGLQARYGGTTGTGAFATEVAGSQTLKNIGAIRQGLSNAMLEIDTKVQQVQEIGRIALQDIEDTTRDQIAKEKANLQTGLAEIRRMKGELQSRKAELAAQAIQMYQNTVNEVNARNAQFKQTLFMQQQSAEQQLKLAGQKAKEVAQSYNIKDLAKLAQGAAPLIKSGFTPTFQGELEGGGRFNLGPTKVEEEDDFTKKLKQASQYLGQQ